LFAKREIGTISLWEEKREEGLILVRKKGDRDTWSLAL